MEGRKAITGVEQGGKDREAQDAKQTDDKDDGAGEAHGGHGGVYVLGERRVMEIGRQLKLVCRGGRSLSHAG